MQHLLLVWRETFKTCNSLVCCTSLIIIVVALISELCLNHNFAETQTVSTTTENVLTATQNVLTATQNVLTATTEYEEPAVLGLSSNL